MYTCGNHLVMVIPTSSNSRSGQPSALFVPALSVSGPSKGSLFRYVSHLPYEIVNSFEKYLHILDFKIRILLHHSIKLRKHGQNEYFPYPQLR